jgi:hypothetical protein
MELPALFPTEIRTWFDETFDPRRAAKLQQPSEVRSTDGARLRQPISSRLRRHAPPLTPQQFALPHGLGEALEGLLPANFLPPIHRHAAQAARLNAQQLPMQLPLLELHRCGSEEYSFTSLHSATSLGRVTDDQMEAQEAPGRYKQLTVDVGKAPSGASGATSASTPASSDAAERCEQLPEPLTGTSEAHDAAACAAPIHHTSQHTSHACQPGVARRGPSPAPGIPPHDASLQGACCGTLWQLQAVLARSGC